MGKGAEFIEAFKPRLGGKPVDPYAIYGAQAEVMLNAIAASDGSRGDVIAKLFEQKIDDGYLGTFEINENGDPGGAEGGSRGLHDLQGHGQARNGDDDLPEAGGRRGRPRLAGRGQHDRSRGRALALPRLSFRFLPSWHRP